VNPVQRVVVSTYQAVSVNSTALKELTDQAKMVLEGRHVSPHIYSHQIAFNVLPEIGVFSDNGYTREERKISLLPVHTYRNAALPEGSLAG
jgi:aspartate-semialdehyde dehydrogenase